MADPNETGDQSGDQAGDLHPVGVFVHHFHALLSEHFTGRGTRETVLEQLRGCCEPGVMTLVYPSGAELSGEDFITSIADAWATSPGFAATIHGLRVIHEGPGHAVVAYEERQSGARRSDSDNGRSALACVIFADGRWRWRFIQETANPRPSES